VQSRSRLADPPFTFHALTVRSTRCCTALSTDSRLIQLPSPLSPLVLLVSRLSLASGVVSRRGHYSRHVALPLVDGLSQRPPSDRNDGEPLLQSTRVLPCRLRHRATESLPAAPAAAFHLCHRRPAATSHHCRLSALAICRPPAPRPRHPSCLRTRWWGTFGHAIYSPNASFSQPRLGRYNRH